MSDLRKIRASAGTLRVEIDDPIDLRIQQPSGILRGWLAARNEELPAAYTFRIGRMTLPHRPAKRLDVEEAMPDYEVCGFEIRYDLSDLLPHIQNQRLTIRLKAAGYEAFLFRFRIDDAAIGNCLSAAGGV